MAGRWIALVLLTLLASIPRTVAAQERAPDELSQLLFDTYLSRLGKNNTSTVMAASQIVADRGRESGFWKNVLAKLKTNDEHSEVACVRILGNMLAADASARDSLKRQKETGEISASIVAVRLGPEVVTELLERGTNKADRFRVDHYTIALARARVPEARDFLTSILVARRGPAAPPVAGLADVPTGFYHLESTRLHAAVGLAQLGDAAGLDWLIANCEDINGHVSHARPYGASSGGLGSCCTAALQQLSGESGLTTTSEWEAWAKTADKTVLTSRSVWLLDP
jgi:hypothetical protein